MGIPDTVYHGDTLHGLCGPYRNVWMTWCWSYYLHYGGGVCVCTCMCTLTCEQLATLKDWISLLNHSNSLYNRKGFKIFFPYEKHANLRNPAGTPKPDFKLNLFWKNDDFYTLQVLCIHMWCPSWSVHSNIEIVFSYLLLILWSVVRFQTQLAADPGKEWQLTLWWIVRF